MCLMRGLAKFLFGGILGAIFGFLVSPKRGQQVREALFPPAKPHPVQLAPAPPEPVSPVAAVNEPEPIAEPAAWAEPEVSSALQPEAPAAPEPELLVAVPEVIAPAFQPEPGPEPEVTWAESATLEPEPAEPDFAAEPEPLESEVLEDAVPEPIMDEPPAATAAPEETPVAEPLVSFEDAAAIFQPAPAEQAAPESYFEPLVVEPLEETVALEPDPAEPLVEEVAPSEPAPLAGPEEAAVSVIGEPASYSPPDFPWTAAAVSDMAVPVAAEVKEESFEPAPEEEPIAAEPLDEAIPEPAPEPAAEAAPEPAAEGAPEPPTGLITEPEPEPEPEISLEGAGAPALEAMVPADLKARIEETRRRIQRELEQPFGGGAGGPERDDVLTGMTAAAQAVPAQAAPAEATPLPEIHLAAEPEPAILPREMNETPPLQPVAVATPESTEPQALESVEAAPLEETPQSVAALPETLPAAVAEPAADEASATSSGNGSSAPTVDSVALETEPEAAAEGDFDHDAMRRRIEETRNRLKAKAFDAMMSGEGALLGREGAATRPEVVQVQVDSEVERTIESTLTEEDF